MGALALLAVAFLAAFLADFFLVVALVARGRRVSLSGEGVAEVGALGEVALFLGVGESSEVIADWEKKIGLDLGFDLREELRTDFEIRKDVLCIVVVV